MNHIRIKKNFCRLLKRTPMLGDVLKFFIDIPLKIILHDGLYIYMHIMSRD